MEQYDILMEDENLIDFSSIQTEAYKLLIEQPAILEEIQKKREATRKAKKEAEAMARRAALLAKISKMA